VNTSWFMWVWACVAVLVVSGMLAVVVLGLTVLRLVRRNWARLVSEALNSEPRSPSMRPPASRRSPRLDARHERA